MSGSRSMRRRQTGAGEDIGNEPTPGWKGHGGSRFGWRNPRSPSVPATLALTLEDYFAAGALIGLLASQTEEPNQRWCCDWSFKMGRAMANEARKRRRAMAR